MHDVGIPPAPEEALAAKASEEPVVGGAGADSVVGEVREAVRAAVGGGDDLTLPHGDPWQAWTLAAAHGGAPCAADGAERARSAGFGRLARTRSRRSTGRSDHDAIAS